MIRNLVLSAVIGLSVACAAPPPPPPPAALHELILSVDNDTTTIAPGDTLPFFVMAHIGDGVVNQTTAVRFFSTDSAVVAVAPGGLARAVRPGTVEITAELDGVRSNAVRVEVVAAEK